MSLTFFEPTHKYQLRGQDIPCISDALQASNIPDFSFVPKATIEYARQRGKAVHKATELFDKGTLDVDTVDPVISGYVTAWEKFCIEYDIWHISIELQVYSELLWCAGTLDRISNVRGVKTLLDIKSGDYEESANFQTAGYEIFAKERGIKDIKQRMIVKLNEDGTYKLAPQSYFKQTDYDDVRALIRTYHIKKRLGKV